MFFLLFAQAAGLSPEPSGWAGAGLLGLVLAWLLFIHLPAKDKQIVEANDKKDIQMASVLATMTEERDKDRTDREADRIAFWKRMELIADSLREHTKELITAFDKGFDGLPCARGKRCLYDNQDGINSKKV